MSIRVPYQTGKARKTIVLSLNPIAGDENTKSPMLDFNGCEIVQVQVSTNPDGTETLWVNIDGVCRLRVCRPGQIILSDERRKK